MFLDENICYVSGRYDPKVCDQIASSIKSKFPEKIESVEYPTYLGATPRGKYNFSYDPIMVSEKEFSKIRRSLNMLLGELSDFCSTEVIESAKTPEERRRKVYSCYATWRGFKKFITELLTNEEIRGKIFAKYKPPLASSDSSIAKWAENEGYLIVTADRHFSEIPSTGVIYVKIKEDDDVDERIKKIEEALTKLFDD